MSKQKKYILRVGNEFVEVDRECYMAFYKSRRREKYLQESDKAHGKVSYHALDTDGYSGEEIIPDYTTNLEDQVVALLMAEKLRRCLLCLSESEMRLIHDLYYIQKSERELAVETHIPNMTIHCRKAKILAKLKKMMEK